MVDISFRVNAVIDAVIDDLHLQQQAVDMWVKSLLLLHTNLLPPYLVPPYLVPPYLVPPYLVPPYLVPPETLKNELTSLGNSAQLHNLGL